MFHLSRDFERGRVQLMDGQDPTNEIEPDADLVLGNIASILKESSISLEELIGDPNEANFRFSAWRHWRDELCPEFEERYIDLKKRAGSICIVDIDWLRKGDDKIVRDIAQKFSADPLHADLEKNLSFPENTLGKVAQTFDGDLVGFVIYELSNRNKDLYILHGGVAEEAKRHLVGSQMVDDLIRQARMHKRNRILAEVWERNLSAQLFLRAQGFRAVSIHRNISDDPSETSYVMEYSMRENDYELS
jgi:ribosomal protein S18 acetylase RimI-like enzyme